MSIIVNVNIRAKAGHAEELARGILQAQKLALVEEQNQGASVLRNADDAHQLVIHEIWDSREAYEAFNRRVTTMPEVTTLFEMIDGELDYRYFETVV